MKYWSEVTKSFYDTEKACVEAEFKAKEEENRQRILREKHEREKKEKQEQLTAQRKARAAEVEDARKAMNAAQSKYRELLENFVKDYNAYHLSLTGEDAKNIVPSLFDVFNQFFL